MLFALQECRVLQQHMLCALQAAARAGFHVSNWLLDIVLTMLVHHTFLGFELEVYAPFEYTTDADTRRATCGAARSACIARQ